MLNNCVVLLGGSFDPVHNGHIALGSYFCQLLQTDQLRIIPTGNPWQKAPLKASQQQRVDMLNLAFASTKLLLSIDLQEIERDGVTYTIDTLYAIRDEVGPTASLVFIIGFDQLKQLDTWHKWHKLFDYAHICAATRPGFSDSAMQLPDDVKEAFTHRLATPQQIKTTPYGFTYLANDLALDISSTQIRTALQHSEKPYALVPAEVLDYIEKNNLYRE